jgi:hypothetical protein
MNCFVIAVFSQTEMDTEWIILELPNRTLNSFEKESNDCKEKKEKINGGTKCDIENEKFARHNVENENVVSYRIECEDENLINHKIEDENEKLVTYKIENETSDHVIIDILPDNGSDYNTDSNYNADNQRDCNKIDCDCTKAGCQQGTKKGCKSLFVKIFSASAALSVFIGIIFVMIRLKR